MSLVVTDAPATGQPTISGGAQVSKTLTAATDDIEDLDGLPTTPTFTYQWVRVDGLTDTDIPGKRKLAKEVKPLLNRTCKSPTRKHSSRANSGRRSTVYSVSPGRIVGTLITYGERASDRPELFEAGALSWPDGGIVLNRQHSRVSPVMRVLPQVVGDSVVIDAALPDTAAATSAPCQPYPAGAIGRAVMGLWWSDDQIERHLLGWYKDGELTDQRGEATPIEFIGSSYSLEWALPAHPNTLPRLGTRPR